MSKQLITADNIREIKAKGQSEIEVSLTNCIITPEAKEVAEQLGIRIVDKNSPPAAKPNAQKCSSSLSETELKVIRQAIIEQLPKGAMISDALIDQLVCKAVQENKHTAAPKTANQKPSAVKLVKGNMAKLEIFEGAGIEKQVGIADMIGAADNSNMAAGYMAWENAFFPWTLNYDEINIVLEGELHICHNNEVKVAKAGDLIFIPKGSSIQFGTPTKVRFVYVSWPANWQDQ
ncbi:ethanolamine utilization acetate kinase EutQ [Entomomonas asaccharolytica]|uniref:Ethanolamine utilization acetate kinase EutQ n=1 Tax=Entomomonas asaccharolytica TaxID=2785331 RepID=A0A974NHU5_9GAMM|nr:ethanolamine utilization acetate kinase EutQ [Entomomonas asaccharolytica]QQP86739.1 ethanolamine utilization acetate kinase EutQ [Entomomonas asaccharolytica]